MATVAARDRYRARDVRAGPDGSVTDNGQADAFVIRRGRRVENGAGRTLRRETFHRGRVCTASNPMRTHPAVCESHDGRKKFLTVA